MTPASSPWSPQQQAWLQAMGYTVFQQGSALEMALPEPALERAPPMPDMAPPARRASAASVPPVPEFAPAPRLAAEPERKQAPPAAVETPPARAAVPGSRRVPSIRLPDRLQIALLRASGCDPSLPETQALMDSWPIAQLRRDPAAKRALWPQLRALRKRSRS